MARDAIQIQPWPVSSIAMAPNARCQDAVCVMCRPDGYISPECSNTTYCRLSRGVCQCQCCHSQLSLIAATIGHATKLPLRTWFRAFDLLTQRKRGLPAVQLSRELAVAYNTAWQLKPKSLQVRRERNEQARRFGRIEIDDATGGGERPGTPGRGAAGKPPFVAAVQTCGDGQSTAAGPIALWDGGMRPGCHQGLRALRDRAAQQPASARGRVQLDPHDEAAYRTYNNRSAAYRRFPPYAVASSGIRTPFQSGGINRALRSRGSTNSPMPQRLATMAEARWAS